ncbi:hypothetical protein RchiOBHm_Chr1g0368551 [Rosa chinensis]|uniref:Uncharacterized protein n=1 Tax=Rosa chinensis TaxID=74649 RepID=A0A2P6SKV0_ROSCH|nr:hypothetical protein RchiOBHm_Chr1g0368551 [Rosa chinensis]
MLHLSKMIIRGRGQVVDGDVTYSHKDLLVETDGGRQEKRKGESIESISCLFNDI